jgi:hypothetical protein
MIHIQELSIIYETPDNSFWNNKVLTKIKKCSIIDIDRKRLISPYPTKGRAEPKKEVFKKWRLSLE